LSFTHKIIVKGTNILTEELCDFDYKQNLYAAVLNAGVGEMEYA
jgi:hypothetical protein